MKKQLPLSTLGILVSGDCSVLEHREAESWLHFSVSPGLPGTPALLTPARKGSAPRDTPAPEAPTDLGPALPPGG